MYNNLRTAVYNKTWNVNQVWQVRLADASQFYNIWADREAEAADKNSEDGEKTQNITGLELL